MHESSWKIHWAAPVPIVWQFCSSFTVSTVTSTPGIFLYGLNVATYGGSGEQPLDLKFPPWFIPPWLPFADSLGSFLMAHLCKLLQEKSREEWEQFKISNCGWFLWELWALSTCRIEPQGTLFFLHIQTILHFLKNGCSGFPVAVILLGKTAGIWGKPNVTLTH